MAPQPNPKKRKQGKKDSIPEPRPKKQQQQFVDLTEDDTVLRDRSMPEATTTQNDAQDTVSSFNEPVNTSMYAPIVVTKGIMRPTNTYPRFPDGDIYIELRPRSNKHAYKLHRAVLCWNSTALANMIWAGWYDLHEDVAAKTSAALGISARFELMMHPWMDLEILVRSNLTMHKNGGELFYPHGYFPRPEQLNHLGVEVGQFIQGDVARSSSEKMKNRPYPFLNAAPQVMSQDNSQAQVYSGVAHHESHPKMGTKATDMNDDHSINGNLDAGILSRDLMVENLANSAQPGSLNITARETEELDTQIDHSDVTPGTQTSSSVAVVLEATDSHTDVNLERNVLEKNAAGEDILVLGTQSENETMIMVPEVEENASAAFAELTTLQNTVDHAITSTDDEANREVVEVDLMNVDIPEPRESKDIVEEPNPLSIDSGTVDNQAKTSVSSANGLRLVDGPENITLTSSSEVVNHVDGTSPSQNMDKMEVDETSHSVIEHPTAGAEHMDAILGREGQRAVVDQAAAVVIDPADEQLPSMINADAANGLHMPENEALSSNVSFKEGYISANLDANESDVAPVNLQVPEQRRNRITSRKIGYTEDEQAGRVRILKPKADILEAYGNLFAIFYSKTPSFSTTDIEVTLRQAELLVRVAEAFNCAGIVVPGINHALFTLVSELPKAILDDPPRWLMLSVKVNCAYIYRIAVVHMAGCYPTFPASVFTEHDLPIQLVQFIERNQNRLAMLISEVDKKLFCNNVAELNGPGASTKENELNINVWYIVQIWRNWLTAAMTPAPNSAGGEVYNECGVLYRLLGKGGDAYLPLETVAAELLVYRSRNGIREDLDMVEVEAILSKLKKQAQQIVAPLCVNNSMVSIEEAGIKYLTCVEVEENDIPWVLLPNEFRRST